MRYYFSIAQVHPKRWAIPSIGRVPIGTRYVVKTGIESVPFFNIHDAVVYHGVGTGFAGDVIRVERSINVPPKGTLERKGELSTASYVDWSAYGD